MDGEEVSILRMKIQYTIYPLYPCSCTGCGYSGEERETRNIYQFNGNCFLLLRKLKKMIFVREWQTPCSAHFFLSLNVRSGTEPTKGGNL